MRRAADRNREAYTIATAATAIAMNNKQLTTINGISRLSSVCTLSLSVKTGLAPTLDEVGAGDGAGIVGDGVGGAIVGGGIVVVDDDRGLVVGVSVDAAGDGVGAHGFTNVDVGDGVGSSVGSGVGDGGSLVPLQRIVSEPSGPRRTPVEFDGALSESVTFGVLTAASKTVRSTCDRPAGPLFAIVRHVPPPG